jgi:hypothetical protein
MELPGGYWLNIADMEAFDITSGNNQPVSVRALNGHPGIF